MTLQYNSRIDRNHNAIISLVVSLLAGHSQSTIQANDLAIQVGVLDHVLHQHGKFIRLTQSRWEWNHLAQSILRLPKQRARMCQYTLVAVRHSRHTFCGKPAIIGVAMIPGAIVLTRMPVKHLRSVQKSRFEYHDDGYTPCAASSRAIGNVMATTAPLEAAYAAWPI
jgi:hypothetical protein